MRGRRADPPSVIDLTIDCIIGSRFSNAVNPQFNDSPHPDAGLTREAGGAIAPVRHVRPHTIVLTRGGAANQRLD